MDLGVVDGGEGGLDRVLDVLVALARVAELVAIVASVDGMPLEYAQQAMQTWPLDDWKALWGTAWSVQERKRSDLGKG